MACVMVSWEEEGGCSWEEVGGGDAKGAVWEFVEWVMRSTACPRWEEGLRGGAIVGEGGGNGVLTCEGEGKGGARVEVVTGDEGGEE